MSGASKQRFHEPVSLLDLRLNGIFDPTPGETLTQGILDETCDRDAKPSSFGFGVAVDLFVDA